VSGTPYFTFWTKLPNTPKMYLDTSKKKGLFFGCLVPNFDSDRTRRTGAGSAIALAEVCRHDVRGQRVMRIWTA
jgi:hypothetical protein